MQDFPQANRNGEKKDGPFFEQKLRGDISVLSYTLLVRKEFRKSISVSQLSETEVPPSLLFFSRAPMQQKAFHFFEKTQIIYVTSSVPENNLLPLNSQVVLLIISFLGNLILGALLVYILCRQPRFPTAAAAALSPTPNVIPAKPHSDHQAESPDSFRAASASQKGGPHIGGPDKVYQQTHRSYFRGK